MLQYYLQHPEALLVPYYLWLLELPHDPLLLEVRHYLEHLLLLEVLSLLVNRQLLERLLHLLSLVHLYDLEHLLVLEHLMHL